MSLSRRDVFAAEIAKAFIMSAHEEMCKVAEEERRPYQSVLASSTVRVTDSILAELDRTKKVDAPPSAPEDIF